MRLRRLCGRGPRGAVWSVGVRSVRGAVGPGRCCRAGLGAVVVGLQGFAPAPARFPRSAGLLQAGRFPRVPGPARVLRRPPGGCSGPSAAVRAPSVPRSPPAARLRCLARAPGEEPSFCGGSRFLWKKGTGYFIYVRGFPRDKVACPLFLVGAAGIVLVAVHVGKG